MIQKRNKETGLMEFYIPAKITEIRSEILHLNNEKRTPYKLGNCSINYPDGGSENVLTRFYKKSLEAHPNTFKVGMGISLRIQAEGTYLGRAIASLPSATVDIARLLSKETPAIKENKKSTEKVTDSEITA